MIEADRVTVREATELTGVPQSTIRSWITSGRLDVEAIPPQPQRVSLDEVRRLAAGRQRLTLVMSRRQRIHRWVKHHLTPILIATIAGVATVAIVGTVSGAGAKGVDWIVERAQELTDYDPEPVVVLLDGDLNWVYAVYAPDSPEPIPQALLVGICTDLPYYRIRSAQMDYRATPVPQATPLYPEPGTPGTPGVFPAGAGTLCSEDEPNLTLDPKVPLHSLRRGDVVVVAISVGRSAEGPWSSTTCIEFEMGEQDITGEVVSCDAWYADLATPAVTPVATPEMLSETPVVAPTLTK